MVAEEPLSRKSLLWNEGCCVDIQCARCYWILLLHGDDYRDALNGTVNGAEFLLVGKLVLENDSSDEFVCTDFDLGDSTQTIGSTKLVAITDETLISNLHIAMSLEPFVWKYQLIPTFPSLVHRILEETKSLCDAF